MNRLGKVFAEASTSFDRLWKTLGCTVAKEVNCTKRPIPIDDGLEAFAEHRWLLSGILRPRLHIDIYLDFSSICHQPLFRSSHTGRRNSAKSLAAIRLLGSGSAVVHPCSIDLQHELRVELELEDDDIFRGTRPG